MAQSAGPGRINVETIVNQSDKYCVIGALMGRSSTNAPISLGSFMRMDGDNVPIFSGKNFTDAITHFRTVNNRTFAWSEFYIVPDPAYMTETDAHVRHYSNQQTM